MGIMVQIRDNSVFITVPTNKVLLTNWKCRKVNKANIEYKPKYFIPWTIVVGGESRECTIYRVNQFVSVRNGRVRGFTEF